MRGWTDLLRRLGCTRVATGPARGPGRRSTGRYPGRVTSRCSGTISDRPRSRPVERGPLPGQSSPDRWPSLYSLQFWLTAVSWGSSKNGFFRWRTSIPQRRPVVWPSYLSAGGSCPGPIAGLMWPSSGYRHETGKQKQSTFPEA